MVSGQTYILLLFAASLLTACTRKEEESSQLQISLPSKMLYQSVGAQAAPASADLTHFIANVTGPGIPNPILYTWDACRDCSTTISVPSSFTIKDVPPGTDRLIQVLAVYQSSNGPMKFYYGDQKQEISIGGSNANVVIDPLPVNDGQPTISGNIAGRYLTSTNMGPTGDILVMFNPGSGRQKMLIEREMIVAGWFRVFGLDNVGFEYKVQPSNGGPLIDMFGGGVAPLNATIFNPNDQVVKAAIPVHKRFEHSTSSYIESEAEYYVWGWFGDAAFTSTKRIFKPLSASQPFTKLKVYNSAAFLDAEGIPNLPAKNILLDTGSPYSIGRFIGGLASNGGGTAMEDFLPVLHTMIENGNDNAAGFRAPFQFMSAQSLFNISTSGGTKTIIGKVLPGVPSVIDHFRAFKMTGVGMNYRVEKVSCNNLSGYSLADQGVGSINPVTNDFTININMTAAEAGTGTAVVLCAVKNGVMYNNGAFLPPNMFSNGMGGGGPASQIKLELAGITGSSGSDNDVYSGACAPLRVKLLDANNQNASISSVTTVNLTSNASSFTFYANECFGATTSSVTFYPGQQWATVFYKDVSAPASYQIAANSAGLTSAQINYDLLTFTASNNVKIALIREDTFQPVTEIRKFTCLFGHLQYQEAATGKPVPPPTSTPDKTLSFSAPGLDLSANNCETAPYTGGNLFAYTTNKIALEINGTPTNSILVTAAGSTGYYSDTSSPYEYPSSYSIPTSGIMSELRLNVATSMPDQFSNFGYPRGLCLPVRVRAHDGAGYPTELHSNVIISPSSEPGYTLYSDSACTTALSTVSIPVSLPAVEVYMRVNPAQTADINLKVIPSIAGIPSQEISGPVQLLKFSLANVNNYSTAACQISLQVLLQRVSDNMPVPLTYSSSIPYNLNVTGAGPTVTPYANPSACSGGPTGMMSSSLFSLDVPSTASTLYSKSVGAVDSGGLGIQTQYFNFNIQTP